jgi:hypothetical protein
MQHSPIIITSKDGVSMKLNSSHSFFKIPFITQLNLQEPIPILHRNLDLIISGKNYHLMNKDELIGHLEIVDMLSLIDCKIKVLDFLLKNYGDSFDPRPYLTPDVLNIKPTYFLQFPDLIDNYYEIFARGSISIREIMTLRKNKFLQSCKDNKIEEAKLLFDPKFANEGLKIASGNACAELVHFFMQNGANNWNDGMRMAAKGGHTGLIDIFIANGANDWRQGMRYAIKGGHVKIAFFFKKKGAVSSNRVFGYAARYQFRWVLLMYVFLIGPLLPIILVNIFMENSYLAGLSCIIGMIFVQVIFLCRKNTRKVIDIFALHYCE